MKLNKSFAEFVIDQIREVGNISYKYMFGGCAIYCGKKVVALICDDQLFVRPTEKGRQFIGIPNEEPPYPGAKLHFLIDDEIDNKAWLCDLIKITSQELPASKIPAGRGSG